MLETLVNLLFWGLVGGLPGFYVTLFKQYNPLYGIGIGALAGILIGQVGVSLGVVNSNTAAGGIIIILWLIAGLLAPRGGYDEKVSNRQRMTNIAYALTVPTVLIVFGIVVFPVIWNVIFSLREIDTGDLAGVNVFDVSNLTTDNFESQMGIRIDTVPCERDEESGACLTDEETGATIYEDARRFVGSEYRGYREVNTIARGEEAIAIGVRDREFYPMIGRTIFYTLSSTILAIVVGLIAAIIVRDAFPGRSVFRGFLLFPYIAPVISVAFIWQVLLRQNGLINESLGTSISFLSTNDTFLGISIPLLMVILFQTWRYFPFAFLFLLARLQAIPDDIYEAAKVDGASPSQRLFYITIPQLRAVLGTLFLLRFIWTFNKFDDVYLLTGPISQTKVIPVQIFEALFTEGNVGEASAIAVVMAAMLAVILLIYFRFFLVEEA